MALYWTIGTAGRSAHARRWQIRWAVFSSRGRFNTGWTYEPLWGLYRYLEFSCNRGRLIEQFDYRFTFYSKAPTGKHNKENWLSYIDSQSHIFIIIVTLKSHKGADTCMPSAGTICMHVQCPEVTILKGFRECFKLLELLIWLVIQNYLYLAHINIYTYRATLL